LYDVTAVVPTARTEIVALGNRTVTAVTCAYVTAVRAFSCAKG